MWYRKGLFFILFLSLIFTGACQKKSKEQLLNEGKKLLESGNPKGAIVLFKTALEKDKNFVDARFLLAQAYKETGRLEIAEKELKKVVLQRPSDKKAHLELARVYLGLKLPDKALNEILPYLKQHEPSPEVLEIAGLASVLKKENSVAIGYFKRALKSAPGRVKAAVSLSNLYLQLGNADDALNVVKRALKISPDNKSLLYAYAQIMNYNNDLDSVLEIYDRILNKNPSELYALYQKGIILIKKEKYKEALKTSEKLIKNYPKLFVGYKLKGIVKFIQKDYDNALVSLELALSKRPDAAAYYYKGLSLLYKGNTEQALTAFYNCLDQNPNFTKARLLISMILLNKGRYDDAITEAKKVVEKEQNNALAHNILGSAYMQKGLYDRGMDEFNRAIKLDPSLVSAHLKKGLYYLKSGKTVSAETEFKTALKIKPDALQSRILLASYYIQKHNYDRAIATIRDGLTGKKQDALLHNILARLYLTKNKPDLVTAELNKAIQKNNEYLPSYFNLATVYLLTGRQQKAIDTLKDVLKVAPDNLRALLTLAAYYDSVNNNKEAEKFYNKALITRNKQAYLSFAKYYLRNRKPEKALKTINIAIDQNLTGKELYELKGIIQHSLRRYQDALETFDALKGIDLYRGIRYMVDTYFSMNSPSKAIKLLKEEIEKRPDDIRILAELVRAYIIEKNTDKAITTASNIIKKAENSPVGYLALSNVLMRKGDYNGAIKSLREGLTKNKKAIPLYVTLSGIYRRRGDYKKALSVLKKAKEIVPASADLAFTEGAIYQETGNIKKAISAYDEALSYSSRHFPSLNNLAYIYANNPNTLKKALVLASRAYILAPYKPEIQDTLGYVLLKNGEAEKAKKLFEKASQLLPDNPSILYHLGIAYFKTGEKNRAIEVLNRALKKKHFPEYSDAKKLLERVKRG